MAIIDIKIRTPNIYFAILGAAGESLFTLDPNEMTK